MDEKRATSPIRFTPNWRRQVVTFKGKPMDTDISKDDVVHTNFADNPNLNIPVETDDQEVAIEHKEGSMAGEARSDVDLININEILGCKSQENPALVRNGQNTNESIRENNTITIGPCNDNDHEEIIRASDRLRKETKSFLDTRPDEYALQCVRAQHTGFVTKEKTKEYVSKYAIRGKDGFFRITEYPDGDFVARRLLDNAFRIANVLTIYGRCFFRLEVSVTTDMQAGTIISEYQDIDVLEDVYQVKNLILRYFTVRDNKIFKKEYMFDFISVLYDEIRAYSAETICGTGWNIVKGRYKYVAGSYCECKLNWDFNAFYQNDSDIRIEDMTRIDKDLSSLILFGTWSLFYSLFGNDFLYPPCFILLGDRMQGEILYRNLLYTKNYKSAPPIVKLGVTEKNHAKRMISSSRDDVLGICIVPGMHLKGSVMKVDYGMIDDIVIRCPYAQIVNSVPDEFSNILFLVRVEDIYVPDSVIRTVVHMRARLIAKAEEDPTKLDAYAKLKYVSIAESLDSFVDFVKHIGNGDDSFNSFVACLERGKRNIELFSEKGTDLLGVFRWLISSLLEKQTIHNEEEIKELEDFLVVEKEGYICFQSKYFRKAYKSFGFSPSQMKEIFSELREKGFMNFYGDEAKEATEDVWLPKIAKLKSVYKIRKDFFKIEEERNVT